jgi:hypothetical protein
MGQIQVKPGDAALYRPHNPAGAIVALLTRARYCHVRLITDTTGATVEADLKGAIVGRIQPGDVIVSPPLTDAQRAKIPAIAAGVVGTPYGFLDILALLLASFGLRFRWLAHRIERSDRLICSQLVDTVWHAADFDAFTDDRLPQDVTPGDIADLALANGWTTTTYTA